MLTLEPPFHEIEGVTVLRDHHDPDLFYFLPPRPRLASCTLFKYRFDLTDNPERDPTQATGAGLALIEVQAAPTPEESDRLRLEVVRLTGRGLARLVAAPFLSGEARAIVARTEGDRLVEAVVETRAAPLTSPHHAAFTLALTAEGATLFEQALAGGTLPVGFVYELRFDALMPALNARVRMDYGRVYDRIAASVGVQYYVRAELDLDLAWLIENGAIQIEITIFSDAADRLRQHEQVMGLVKARIEQDFFRTSMPARPTAGGGMLGAIMGLFSGGGEPSASSAYLVLKAKYERQEERKVFVLHFNGRAAIPLTHVCSGFLGAMIDPEQPPVVRLLEADDPFFSRLKVTVSSALDFEAMPEVLRALVHLERGEHRASFAFSRDAAEVGPYVWEVPLTRAGDDEYAWRVEYVFDAEQGDGPPALAAGPFTARDRELVVHPLAHFRHRRIHLMRGPVDAALVPRIWVRLSVAGREGEAASERTVTLGEAQPEATWRVHRALDAPPVEIRLQADWEDPHGQVHEGDVIEPSGETQVVLGPYRDVLELDLQPVAAWERVTLLRVEVRYEDGEHVVDRDATFTVADGLKSRRLEIPLRDPRQRTYRWRQVVSLTDGTLVETEWEATDVRLLTVGHLATRERPVKIVLVGTAEGLLGVRVDLRVESSEGEDTIVSAFLRGGSDSQATLLVPLDPDGRLLYHYDVVRFDAQGETPVKSGETETTLLIVHPAG